MLNIAQEQAVNCNDQKILCLAGAGTGKTYSVISRIERLVSEGVDPKSILALTFTNVAAFEMKTRYESLNLKAPGTPEFRTFHSFCYYLMSIDSNVRKQLGYNYTPNIADEATEKRINREAMLQTGIKLSEKKLNDKTEVLSQKEAYDLMMILKASERLMKKKNLITFDALCKGVCDLFVADNDAVKQYKERFKYVFCDEYQDTDKRQDAFVKSFTNSNLFVVGDALQALYAFRNADSSIIKALSVDGEWTTIKLHENYRSTKNICGYANRFSKSYADDTYRIAIDSDRQGPEVQINSYNGSRSKGYVPTTIIDSIVESTQSLSGSTAILVRTNAEVSSIQLYLKDKDIPFSSVKSNLDAINLLKCILDDNYTIDWLSTYLTSDRYSEYIRRSTLTENYSLQDFVEEFKWHNDIWEQANTIFKLRKACQTIPTPQGKCNEILRILKCSKINIEIPDNVRTISKLIDRLIEAVTDYQASASELYVGTVHSVKGLEYDNVFVVGPHGRSWNLDNEDNNNLFYVAVTRAKTNLTIYFGR